METRHSVGSNTVEPIGGSQCPGQSQPQKGQELLALLDMREVNDDVTLVERDRIPVAAVICVEAYQDLVEA